MSWLLGFLAGGGLMFLFGLFLGLLDALKETARDKRRLQRELEQERAANDASLVTALKFLQQAQTLSSPEQLRILP